MTTKNITFWQFLKKIHEQYPEPRWRYKFSGKTAKNFTEKGLPKGVCPWLVDFAHDAVFAHNFFPKRAKTRIQVLNHLRDEGACREAIIGMYHAWNAYRLHTKTTWTADELLKAKFFVDL